MQNGGTEGGASGPAAQTHARYRARGALHQSTADSDAITSVISVTTASDWATVMAPDRVAHRI